MVKYYKVLPSQLLGIEDKYTAYCFDEACTYIIARMEKGEEPTFESKKKHYKSFSDLYKNFD